MLVPEPREKIMGREMLLQLKVLVTKSKDLSQILRNPTVKGENRFLQVVLTSAYVACLMPTPTHIGNT